MSDLTQLLHAISANAAGFASVNAVMAEANSLLCRKGNIPAGDSDRNYATALNNALTNGNLSTNFVQPRPCSVSF